MGDNIKKIGIRNDSGEYTYTDIGVDADNVDIDSTTLDQKISTIEEDITKKVDKVEGKGLSSNDFTDEHLSVVETMSAGIVTGIKGNAEDDYRTGDVNLTAENIGALPVDGTAKKATADANGNVIPDTYATKDELTDSNNTLASDIVLNRQTLGYSKKNLLKNTATSTTENGVTFTVNDDGSVTVNGTATAQARFLFKSNLVFDEDTILSLKGTTYDGVSGWYSGGNVFGDEKTVPAGTSYGGFFIFVNTGVTVNNVTVYPMIRSAEITDGTYEPYVDDVDTRLQKIDDSIMNDLVSGVKGNAESTYRNGNVNLTAENIGALPVDGTADKAISDGNGNNIIDTYATKQALIDNFNNASNWGNTIFESGDVNTWRKPGIYSSIGGQTSNLPTISDGWATVVVIRSNNAQEQLTQICWNWNNAPETLYKRTSNSNGTDWSNWVAIIDSDNYSAHIKSVNSIIDYNDASNLIQVGYAKEALTADTFKYFAGYTYDGDSSNIRIKDVSPEVVKEKLGISGIEFQIVNGELQYRYDTEVWG